MAIRRLLAVASLAAVIRVASGADEFTTVPQRDDRRASIDLPVVAVSASGRHIAFASYAPLVPADTNAARDIYVFDRASGRVTLESGAADGGPPGADSTHPGITADGRLLVYLTAVAGPQSLRSAVVLRDRAMDTSTIVATSPASAWSGTPVISADGRFVAFVSGATDLAAGTDANGPADDVYVLELASRTIERVSVDAAGSQPATGASFAPAISADGRRIAFVSTAPLGSSDMARAGVPILARPRVAAIYVRDRLDGTTRLVSVAPGGTAADGPAWGPSIDGAGRHVAFVSTATTLTREDRAGGADIFVADLATGAIALVSRSARGGGGNGPSAGPVMSADGRLVAFQSDASDLTCAGKCAEAEEDINLLPDVFLFDRRTAAMTRVSGGPSAGWLEASVGPAIDGSGAVIAFSSRRPIDAADTKNDFDLFIRVAQPSALARALGPAGQRFQGGQWTLPERNRDATRLTPSRRAFQLAWVQSARSATMGSTLPARRAGR